MSYVSGVYLIRNNINDRLYIGSAVNLFQRDYRKKVQGIENGIGVKDAI